MIFFILLFCITATKADPRPGEIVACNYDGGTGARFPSSSFRNCTHVIHSHFSIYSFHRFIQDPKSPRSNEVKEDNRQLLNEKKERPDLKIFLELVYDTWGKMDQGSILLATNVSGYLLENHFDGMVLYLLADPSNEDKLKDDQDKLKKSTEQLLKELKEDLRKHNLVLSLKILMKYSAYCPISESKEIIDYFLLVSLPDESLYTAPSDPLRSKNASITTIESTVNHILGQGVAPSKVIISLTFGGMVSATLEKSKGVFGEKKASEFTFPRRYTEICPLLKNGTRYFDDDSQTSLVTFEDTICFEKGRLCSGPYSVIAYDDSESLIKKVQYAKKLRLGGFYVEYLDSDDIEGDCGEGKQPLMSAAISEIRLPKPAS